MSLGTTAGYGEPQLGTGQPPVLRVATPPGASRWILNPVLDLLLFIGTPALVLPLVLLVERFGRTQDFYLWVTALGATGHHLPGMIRAYGDRALFERFKLRFVVAPIFLIAVCTAVAFKDPELSPVILVLYVWAIWHSTMQTHGFLRIYDAKAKSFGRLTVALDQWMCITWFGAAVLFSSARMHQILESLYLCSGVVVPFAWVHAARVVWAPLTGSVTLAFLVHFARGWRAGHAANGLKLLLLATSLSFWWYSNNAVANLLVGISMWEIFHDVQYLSIVWIFNRKRVEADPGIGSFTRFVFRQRLALIGVYVALVLAYGSIRFAIDLPSQTVHVMLTILLATSALLHFYFDSFIWKVREKSTRTALGLEGGEEAVTGRRSLPSWAPSGLRWALFVVPLAAMGVAASPAEAPRSQSMAALATAFPEYAPAQFNLGVTLQKQGDLEGAARAYRSTLALHSRDREVGVNSRINLFWTLVELAQRQLRAGSEAAALALLQEAAQLDPRLADILNDKGVEMARRGDAAGADLAYRTALLVSPDRGHIRLNLALALRAENRLDEALAEARRARALLPADPATRQLVEALQARTPAR